VSRCCAIILAAAMVLSAACAPRSSTARPKSEDETSKAGADATYYAGIEAAADQMLPRIRRHAAALAELGPRQTGQSGCAEALGYIRSALAEMGLDEQVREFSSEVTVALDRTERAQLGLAEEPFSHVVVEGIGQAPQRWPAYALRPNCAQACATHPPEACPLRESEPNRPDCRNCERPRRLVDLGYGRWEDFQGKDLTDAVVLLEFNSGDAWVRAASLGAAGALFIEPTRTTVFQADAKYMAMLPLHFPRLYLRRSDGLALRKALAESPQGPRVTLKSRLRYQNVPANCIELTVPGKDRSYCFVLAAHFDARCIVPDLSYGGDEVWGIAELIELTRYFAAHQPNCDIHVMFVSGHWQSQQPMRDYLARDREGRHFGRVGRYFRLAMGVDLVPAGRSVNLISESPWNIESDRAYKWLGNHLFRKGGWRERIFRAFELPADVELFGGDRPILSETQESPMADRNDRCPLMFAPRYQTAEQAWQGLGITTFAFQTGRLARLAHDTPLDRLTAAPAETVDEQLRPQLLIALAVLRHLQDYPVNMLPEINPGVRHGAGSMGGYTQLSGRVMQWDRSIGWFAGRLPGTGEAKAPKDGADLKTFLYAFPVDELYTNRIGQRLRSYLHWPMNPSRGQHRELQSFMFQDLRLLEKPEFQVNLVYAAHSQTRYNVVAYTIDAAGRIRFATDFGVHGDGNKAFQCTDLPLSSWDLHVPVSLFECGTLELFNLIDPQRYDPNMEVYGSFLQTYMIHGEHAARGIPPHVRITGVKDVGSHTDLERWGFAQYGPTAMVFLPANYHTGAEVLLGSWFKNFAVLNDPDGTGRGRGYRVKPGERVRLAGGDRLTLLESVRQLTNLNDQRLEEFAAHDVSSPLAKRYHADSAAAVKAGRVAQNRRDWREATAAYMRAWIFESLAYRHTLSLLLDVVSTTVLYFVLLLPFSFLIERLIFPQRTALRTALVSVAVFAAFASILYLFHPGFKLAHNVVVTTTAFIIVVMTIPALVLLLVRGVAMLRAIGSKAVITQQSEAESAGVVMAALSLAVSNMRRRRLRTALTLVTITVLVVALVLLTTSSAFDFRILEPSGARHGSYYGVQVFNSRDRRQPLLKEMAQVYETALSDEALVIRRESVNYGYDHKTQNGSLHLRAGKRRTPVPYFQVMDYRDNRVEYTLTDAAGTRKVRLSDLIDGEFLAPGDVSVCLLPNNMAEDLAVEVGDTVTVMGLPLKVKGIFTAQTRQIQKMPDGGEKVVFLPGPLDRLADLDGLPITAMRSSKWREGEPDDPLHAPSSEIVIVPREWIRRYGVFPTCVYSIVAIPNASEADPACIPSLAERLAKEILNVDVFSHYVDPTTGKSRSDLIAMHTATHVKGSSMMLVVMAVAVLMILAIMTGTVYERMREIHIFSSVGLSPRHVAGMFLVEALVYAGIAAVLGYFVGIISLKGLMWHLKATGQHQEFYPNYLGVFVLYSIGVAVLATLASSLYPIRLASRIVNPSEGRTWQLDAVGDERDWRIRLPFIATTWDEARAMMVYARDYLAIHQGERSGRFVCQTRPEGGTVDDSIHLNVPVWLAPFERNLTQDAALLASPSADRAWWELSLKLTRVSGPPYLWRRGATVFVNMLCKHLLRWRAATPAQEADCLKRSDRLFPRKG